VKLKEALASRVSRTAHDLSNKKFAPSEKQEMVEIRVKRNPVSRVTRIDHDLNNKKVSRVEVLETLASKETRSRADLEETPVS